MSRRTRISKLGGSLVILWMACPAYAGHGTGLGYPELASFWSSNGYAALTGVIGLAGILLATGLFVQRRRLLGELRQAREALARAGEEIDQRDEERIETALPLSEAQFRALAENAGDGILIVRGDGTHAFANRRAAEITGYTSDELLRLRVNELAPPDEWPNLSDHPPGASGGQDVPRPYETSIVRKDGRRAPLELTAAKTTWQGQAATVVIFRDTTQRKHAEEALALNNKRLDLIARLTGSIVDAAPLAELGRELAEQVRATFDVDACVIRTLEDQELVLLAGAGIPEENLHARVPATYGISEHMLSQRRPITIADVRAHPLTAPVVDRLPTAYHFISYAGAPLLMKDRVVGILGVYTKAEEREFTSADLEHLQIIADNIVVSIINGRLYAEVKHHKDRLERQVTERQRAEEALRTAHLELESRVEKRTRELAAANQRLQEELAQRTRMATELRRQALVFENIHDGVIITNPDVRITGWNRGAERMFGYSREDVLGRHPEMLNRASDAANLTREIGDELQTRGRWAGEIHFVRKDGSEGICEVVVVPLVDELGLQMGAVSVNRDVTERKQAEAALRESEAKYRQLFATVSDAIVVFDGETRRFVDVNDAALRLYGYSREEFLTLTQADITAEPETSDASIREALTREVLRIPLRHHRKKDGTVFSVEIAVGVLTLQNRRALCGVVRDITERQRAEEALRESEAKFRTLAETVPAGTMIYQNSRLCYANPAAEQITGFTLQELRDKPAAESPHRGFLSRRAPRESATDRGPNGPLRSELKIKTKAGEERWLDVSTGAMTYNGQPAVLTTAFDITARKQAEELARRRQAELAHIARLSTMGEMAAGLSHELNQPLAAIGNYAKLCVRRIEAGTTDPDRLLDPLEQITAQVRRAAEIVRRTRSFVGRREPHRRPLHLNELVEKMTDFIEYEARSRTVTIRLDLDPSIPPVKADPVEIEQVLLNLLMNAMDAMTDAGTKDRHVTVRTTAADPSRIEVAVVDNGPGIRPDIQKRVFDPFFTTKPEGMGMGLPICRSIIAAHGGELWATPNPDAGMTFRFTLAS